MVCLPRHVSKKTEMSHMKKLDPCWAVGSEPSCRPRPSVVENADHDARYSSSRELSLVICCCRIWLMLRVNVRSIPTSPRLALNDTLDSTRLLQPINDKSLHEHIHISITTTALPSSNTPEIPRTHSSTTVQSNTLQASSTSSSSQQP